MSISINSSFDGGNIHCVDCTKPEHIRLEIVKDHQSDFYQWFYYRVSGTAGVDLTMVIENAEGAAYPGGWEDYSVCASYDRQTWFRVPTTYQDGQLTIEYTPAFENIWFAYFAPYTTERHQDFVASLQFADHTEVSVLGQTLDGQDLDLVQVGTPGAGKKNLWITARQHPGETMAEWWMEGFLGRLLDEDDPVARVLLDKAVFYVVPNMNPDGSKRGHLRTNACGANLNREWDKASLERSPEVFHVLTKMNETGVDFALDVHGDEALPYNFIAGGEGAPSFTPKLQSLLDGYKSALCVASPDFQTKVGYEVDAPGTANLSVCTNYLTDTFKCLAMTLEMPFKDNAELPDPETGWAPERCARLGAANLDAMLAMVDQF